MSHDQATLKLKKKSSSRRRSQLKLLHEDAPNTPHMHTKKRASRKKPVSKSESSHNTKSRRRARSDVDLLRPSRSKHNNDDTHTPHSIEDINFGAAYRKEDIVLTKDTESKMCVIKTIRSRNGLQYGIVIPPESVIRYIKPGKIIKKLQSESVIARIDTITKAYEDANGEMLKSQQQLKMLRKQCEQEKDKFKRLKQRFNDQNASNQASTKRIAELENQNIKLRKDVEQKSNDIAKLKRSSSDDGVYKKQLTDFHKQVKMLNKTITEQKLLINKQKTELSQQKAKSNRNKLDDVSDSKLIMKLKKEKAKAGRTITELRQQLLFERNRTSRISYESDRVGRKHRLQSEYNLEQLGVQQRKLEQKLKKLKNKEAELDQQEKFQKYQQKDFLLNKNRYNVQQQQDNDAQNKLFDRKKKQEMADIEKRRQELLRQQKLLEMNSKWDKMKKKGKNDNKLQRQARVRGQRTKVIIHKKYLCKEYMDTCVKWRKRKDAMAVTSNRLKELEEKLKPKLKRLSKLDENKRISKGKNKLEKPNKSDLKEYLDVSVPLECELEEELGALLLDLHPDGENIKNMPLELLRQQAEMERLQQEIEEMRNEVNKYRLNKKLNDKLSAIDGDIMDGGRGLNGFEDEEAKDNEVVTAATSPYKLEFSGLYRKVANLDENRDEILSELKSLIERIGEDINEENEEENAYMMQLSSDYQQNGFMDFVPRTQTLCSKYSKLERKLKDEDKEQMEEKQAVKSTRKRSKKRKPKKRRKRRYNDTSDSENSYKGTERIHVSKKQKQTEDSQESDDSSSVMVETDDYDDDWSKPKTKTKGKGKDESDWNGTQRMSINNKSNTAKNKMSTINLHKAQQKVDDLSVDAKAHLDGLKEKQNEYKAVKQKISAARRDLTQCQGLLEVIEEEDKKTGHTPDNEDIGESKEILRGYNEVIEKASNNLEDASTSLKKDDERVTKLMQQLQGLQTKIAGKKLKMVQEKFEEIKTETEVIPPPNILELQDLRKKINALYQKSVHDAEWLEKSMRNMEKNKKRTNKLQDKVEELSPSIHKFARRPQTKMLEYMMEYNYDLGGMADKLKDKQDNLAKFADKNQDIRLEQSIEVQKEFAAQQTVLDEYKKTIHILQEQHKGIMFETIDKDKRVTESGPVYELENIMDEVLDLLHNTTQKINDNNLTLRTQQFGCFLCLEEINNTRDLIVDTVQIPIPSKPNIEHLNGDELKSDVSEETNATTTEEEEEDKGAHLRAHLKLSRIRKEHKAKYKNHYVRKLAGLTDYDDTVKLHLALNRIRATLGSVSPLHYAVISDQWLKPEIKHVKLELNKLLRHYQNFKPIKTDISIDDEVSNYELQLVQDLAADYHKVNERDKSFVIEENIKIIQAKLAEFEQLNEIDVRCIELKHLKEMYESFCDENVPQPLPLYSGSECKEERVCSTKKKDYKTVITQKYVGLDDDKDADNIGNLEKMMGQIERELFSQRACVMPFAFNLIYQNGILFKAFPGDFVKFRDYKHAHSDLTDDIVGMADDELLLNAKEYNDMDRQQQIDMIRELMLLEWQYATWMNEREDYVTQKMLWSEEALYYKRLFVLPLDSFHLEKERQNLLLQASVTGQFRNYRKGIYDKKRAEKDRIKAMEEQRMRMKMNGDTKNEEEEDMDSLGDGGMRLKMNGDEKEDDHEHEWSDGRMILGNKGKKKRRDKFENVMVAHDKQHGLGYHDDGDTTAEDEEEDDEYHQQNGKRFKRQKNARKEKRTLIESDLMDEYDSVSYATVSSDSDIDYLSVDSEHALQDSKKVKHSHCEKKMEEKLGARGIGMDVEIGHGATTMYDLEASEFDNIHHSPDASILVANPMISSYIAAQVEQKWSEEQRERDLMEEERVKYEQMLEGSNTDLDEEQSGDTGTDTDSDSDDCNVRRLNDDEDETEDGEDEYILEKLREILGSHQFLEQDGDGSEDSTNDVDGVLDQVENLCRDVDEYSNKYFSTSQRNKKLKNEVERMENELEDIEGQHDLLKQEYMKLRQQNESLASKVRKYERYNTYNKPTPNGHTTAGGYDSDDEFEEKDILNQLQDDLLQLRQDIKESQKSAKSEYKDCKLRLESMCEPLGDLANDFKSDVLKEALGKLEKSCNDISNLQKQRLFQHGPLANIVESNIDDIDDLLHEIEKMKAKKVANQNAVNTNGGVSDMDKYKYPELIYDGDDGKNNIKDPEHEPGSNLERYKYGDDEKDKWKDTPGQNIEFDANFPRVRKIEIDGNWFNKKPRAVIEWNGNEFKRKMADFKWLWRMLMLNSTIDRIPPDYPSDIPESLWPEGYLRRRKRELNLFLMQCHSLPWIKKYKVYNDIFLEVDKKEWKRKRNEQDEDIIDRIKHKQSTYDKTIDVIDNNNDNYQIHTNDNDPNY